MAMAEDGVRAYETEELPFSTVNITCVSPIEDNQLAIMHSSPSRISFCAATVQDGQLAFWKPCRVLDSRLLDQMAGACIGFFFSGHRSTLFTETGVIGVQVWRTLGDASRLCDHLPSSNRFRRLAPGPT